VSEQNLPLLIREFEKKLDGLRNKIASHQSLAASITAEFESLYSDFESMKQKFGASSPNFDVTSNKNGALSDNFESTSYINGAASQNIESSSGKICATSGNFESTRDNDGAISSDILTKKVIRFASSVKVYFAQPNIPSRIAKILSAIPEKGKLSVAEMAKLTGASRNSLVRDIKILKQLGWVKFNGSRKNGYFTLTQEGAQIVGG
jgi:hypothetical protein